MDDAVALTKVPGPVFVCVTVCGTPFTDTAETLMPPGEGGGGCGTGCAIADADAMIPVAAIMW